MKFKVNLFTTILKEMKQAPEAPQMTDFLSSNHTFQNVALKIHNLRLKFWQKVDEAAFPENYKNDKMIEQKKNYENIKNIKNI